MSKTKSTVIIMILSILILFLSGCSTQQAKIGDDITTFEQLKKTKEAGQPVSEYDKCIKEAQEAMKKYDIYILTCTNEKLSKQGYNDGIQCVGSGEYGVNPICDNTNRYNAEVNGYNECLENQPTEIKNGVTIMDCTTLIK